MFHFRGNRHALILVYNNIPRMTINISYYHIKSFSVYKLKMDLFSAKCDNIGISVKLYNFDLRHPIVIYGLFENKDSCLVKYPLLQLFIVYKGFMLLVSKALSCKIINEQRSVTYLRPNQRHIKAFILFFPHFFLL